MKLCDCREGQEIVIKSINSDEITLKRLELMGITVGAKVLVAKESGGSVLATVGGKMIALGHALTQEVTVDACDHRG